MSDVSSGWGRFTWGQAYWNRDALLATGWGAKAWNDGEWGNLADETVSLTGVSFSASLGSVNIVSTNIIIPTGISFTGSVGSISPVIPKTVELGSLSFQSTVDSLTTTADAVDMIVWIARSSTKISAQLVADFS